MMTISKNKWFGLVAVILLAVPAVVLAHATLDHAKPRVGATVEGSPAEVKIWFTDEVDPDGSSIVVQNADGKQVDKKDMHPEGKDKNILIVSLPEVPPGTYTVFWKAKCPCGHVNEGDFEFVVK